MDNKKRINTALDVVIDNLLHCAKCPDLDNLQIVQFVRDFLETQEGFWGEEDYYTWDQVEYCVDTRKAIDSYEVQDCVQKLDTMRSRIE